jgi:TetR/AcrR family transcriptional regulator
MSDTSSLIEPADSVDAEEAPAARKRPKPGERRVQILQALAAMLEQPGAERITTAALAARLSVSEAALYRHFASKAQMFEGLIDFIEQSVFTLVQQITGRDVPAPDQPAEVGLRQASRIIALLLQFGERNPGMVRVMVGDALVFEHERLQQRMNQFFDRIESTLRQCLRASGFRNAHRARPGTGQRADLVRAGAPATFCALGLSPQPYRAPRRQPGADCVR